jgi:hypothetical protein
MEILTGQGNYHNMRTSQDRDLCLHAQERDLSGNGDTNRTED